MLKGLCAAPKKSGCRFRGDRLQSVGATRPLARVVRFPSDKRTNVVVGTDRSFLSLSPRRTSQGTTARSTSTTAPRFPTRSPRSPSASTRGGVWTAWGATTARARPATWASAARATSTSACRTPATPGGLTTACSSPTTTGASVGRDTQVSSGGGQRDTLQGSQVAERLGSRASNQMVAGSIPGGAK